MPCATLHLIAAERVLEHWRARPRRAPFSPYRREPVEAFIHGALAPDQGFVPGTDRLFSEAVHYVRPADFARRLLYFAGSEAEEAFAWGWATHVLADVQVHPLVGRAVGQRLFDDRHLRVDASADVAAHVSMEVGLDIVLLRGKERVRPPPGRAFLRGARGARLVAEAFRETYGVEMDEQALLRDHRRAVGLTRWWPRALRLLPLAQPGAFAKPGGRSEPGEGRGEEPGLAKAGAVAPIIRGRGNARPGELFPRGTVRRSVATLLRRLAGEGTAARGFFGPEEPRPWFRLQVVERMGAFVESFQHLVDDGLAGLENLNLETGLQAGQGRGHPATDEVARRLGGVRRTAEPAVP